MKVLYATSVIALACAVSVPAQAQDETGAVTVPSDETAEVQKDATARLGTVTVTATKREENLQDVPVAVSAITADALQDKGVFDTSDMSGIMPNLQVSSPYGKQQPNFSLRGVGVGTEFNANAASPIGVYVDEVYQAFRSSHGQQLFDLQQVEVVRGPQGTLYGRNTTGGAINFITRSPELEGHSGTVTLGYGNYDRRNVEAALEFTPVEDVFGIRGALSYVNSDPYVDNILPAGLNTSAGSGLSGLNQNSGRSPGGHENISGRITVRFKPSPDMDFKLKVYASDSEGGIEAPIPTGQSTSSRLIDYTSDQFLLGPLFQQLSVGGLLPASYDPGALGLGDDKIEADSVGVAKTKASGVVFDARFNLTDRLDLISISGWDDGEYSQLPTTDCDGTPLRLCAIGYSSDFEALNQDLRLDYDAGNFKGILGVFYGRDILSSDNRVDFFNLLSDVRAAVGLPLDWFNPAGNFNGAGLSASSLPTGIRAEQSFKQVRESAAVYGEASYEFTPSIKLTAGLRYTEDKNDFKGGLTTYFDDAGNPRLITVSNFQQGGAFAPYFLAPVFDEAGNVVIPSFQDLNIPVPGPLEQDGKSSRISGRAILDWKPTDDILLYGSYSRGYRAGTFNGLAYGSANQVYFVPPEEVDAFEIGIKSRFMDDRLQLNAAVFYYDYSGQQGQVVDATATANLISLDGSLQGLEAELLFQASSTLTLSAAIGLIDSEYDSDECPADPTTIPSFPAQLGSCVVSSGGPVSVAGNPFPYAAESSANLGFDWDAVSTPSGILTVHGDANYTGQFYYDSFKDYSRANLPQVASGALSEGEGEYWVLNGRVAWETDRYTFSVWGKNLTDETYYPFGISLENLFGTSYVVRAQPRTYGAEVTVRF